MEVAELLHLKHQTHKEIALYPMSTLEYPSIALLWSKLYMHCNHTDELTVGPLGCCHIMAFPFNGPKYQCDSAISRHLPQASFLAVVITTFFSQDFFSSSHLLAYVFPSSPQTGEYLSVLSQTGQEHSAPPSFLLIHLL